MQNPILEFLWSSHEFFIGRQAQIQEDLRYWKLEIGIVSNKLWKNFC